MGRTQRPLVLAFCISVLIMTVGLGFMFVVEDGNISVDLSQGGVGAYLLIGGGVAYAVSIASYVVSFFITTSPNRRPESLDIEMGYATEVLGSSPRHRDLVFPLPDGFKRMEVTFNSDGTVTRALVRADGTQVVETEEQDLWDDHRERTAYRNALRLFAKDVNQSPEQYWRFAFNVANSLQRGGYSKAADWFSDLVELGPQGQESRG